MCVIVNGRTLIYCIALVRPVDPKILRGPLLNRLIWDFPLTLACLPFSPHFFLFLFLFPLTPPPSSFSALDPLQRPYVLSAAPPEWTTVPSSRVDKVSVEVLMPSSMGRNCFIDHNGEASLSSAQSAVAGYETIKRRQHLH